MKIAYVVETYTEGLGYIDNILPFEWAKSDDEVHIITCRLPVYYQVGGNHFGEGGRDVSSPGIVENLGVKIHTCEFRKFGNRILIKGLGRKIKLINPDVVVVRGLASPVLGQVVFAKLFNSFLLFTSTGQAYSAISQNLRRSRMFSWVRLKNLVTRFIPGWIFNTFTSVCIGSTIDCIDCAVDFYGICKNKAEVISLGVDIEKFYPVSNDEARCERIITRNELGVPESSILCIWTGRMTAYKGIELLAQAIEELNAEGVSIYGLFVGAGPEAEKLTSYVHSIHHCFVPWKELGRLYRAADIAVWPFSITTSTLDASACGLPVIMSNEEVASERWQGIGSCYECGSVVSLKKELRVYLNSETRRMLGDAGAARVRSLYSWPVVAKEFRKVFAKSLNT